MSQPLVFDSLLLASTWTWLALSLATIATLLRALWISPSHRRLASLVSTKLSSPVPSHISPSRLPDHSSSPSINYEACHSSCSKHCCPEFDGGLAKGWTTPGLALPRHKRCRSRSSFALENFVRRNPEGLLVSCLGALTCLFEQEMTFASSAKPFLSRLRKVASLSAFLEEGASPDGKRQWRMMARNIGRSDGLDFMGVDDVRTGVVEAARIAKSWVPWWTTASLREYSSQAKLIVHPPPLEEQHGWEALLQVRLGMSWHYRPASVLGLGLGGQALHAYHPTNKDVVVVHPPYVLTMWTPQGQKGLMRVARVEESMVSYVGRGESLACLATRNGQACLWNVAAEACVSSMSMSSPVLLMMDVLEKTVGITAGAAVDGRSDVLIGSWDYRSSLLKPCTALNVERSSSIAGLKLKGHQLCIAQGHELLTLHDLRMMKEPGYYCGDGIEEEQYWDEGLGVGCYSNTRQQSGRRSLVLQCAAMFRSLPVVATY